MEDVRIGRKTKSRMIFVQLTVALPEVLPARAMRTHLKISCALAEDVAYKFGQPGNTITGFNLPQDGNPHDYDIQVDGDIVRQALFLGGTLGVETIAIIETWLEES